MEQWTGSKLGNEYLRAVFCHPAYIVSEYIMQNARLVESHAELKLPEEISATSDIMIPS